MTTIEIHEFSTAIDYDSFQQNWWVKSYQSGFMNSTLDEIPELIDEAIENGLFKIPYYSQNSDEPVIIGREIKHKREAWSMIAVISAGKDSDGEKTPLYRYFLTEGLDRIPDILTWWNKAGRPKFDPFDVQKMGQPKSYDDKQTIRRDLLSKPQFQTLLDIDTRRTLVLDTNLACTPIIINQLAERIKKGKEPIAWAYNVDTIYAPYKYQVIFPIDSSSEMALNNHLVKYKNNRNFFDIIKDLLQILFISQIPLIFLFLTSFIFLGVGILITITSFLSKPGHLLGLTWLACVLLIFLLGLVIGKRI